MTVSASDPRDDQLPFVFRIGEVLGDQAFSEVRSRSRSISSRDDRRDQISVVATGNGNDAGSV